MISAREQLKILRRRARFLDKRIKEYKDGDPRIAAAERNALTWIIDRATKLPLLIQRYAKHDDWRCENPDTFPWEPDCPCGLTKALREADLPVHWAETHITEDQ